MVSSPALLKAAALLMAAALVYLTFLFVEIRRNYGIVPKFDSSSSEMPCQPFLHASPTEATREPYIAFRPKFSLPPAAKLTPVPEYPLLVNYDPKSHNTSEKGPFVHGWETWVDRNVSRYIRPEEDTILTDLSCLDLSQIRLLILIQSAPQSIKRRNANRQTWMRYQEMYPQVKTLFIFGTSEKGDEPPMQGHVQHEAKQYCDIIQMDYVDSYWNVTLDTVSAIKFAREWKQYSHGRQGGSGSKKASSGLEFVVMGDDDTYINVPSLWSRLFYEAKDHQPYLLGSVFRQPQVLRWTDEEEKKAIDDGDGVRYVNKVVVPDYMYKGEHYPDSLGGGAYVLPFSTLDCLYRATLDLPLFPINDIFITSFAAEACGIARIHDDRFRAGRVDIKELRWDIISVHYASTTKKAVLHHVLHHQAGLAEFRLANRYFLDGENLTWCDAKVNCVQVNEN